MSHNYEQFHSEASKSDYENLFTTINDTLEKVREESPYDQLSLYNTVFMLMYDQRSNMMQVNELKIYFL